MITPVQDHLPIRAIVSLTGVKAITLRAWERRYGLIHPLRTAKGHRLYTHDHVERIRRALALVERGVPISQVREALDALPAARIATRSRAPWGDFIDRMAAAITRFDEPQLDRIYDEALSVHSIENLTRHVILPLLARLGERWQDLAGAIAEEHFFATYLRSKLGARLQHRMRYATGPRLLGACAPGEQHEIGLLLFALEAHEVGMRTVLLGADLPFDQLGAAFRRSGCAAIVISSSIDPAPGLLQQALPALVRKADAPVFVGGATAVRHRAAINAAGAIALGTVLEDGVRLVLAKLGSGESRA